MRRFLVTSLFCILSVCVHAIDVTAVTEHLPPYQIVKNGEVIGGSSYEFMESVFREAKILHHTLALPWARAYKMANENKNTVIYSLFRTSKRESNFHWIGPLGAIPFYVYTTSDGSIVDLVNNDLDDYIAVAVRDSAEADLLKQKGFHESRNLIVVKDYLAVWTMLKLKRADFTIAHKPYQGIIEEAHLKEEDFKTLETISLSMPLYVAASLSTDLELVERLRKAYQVKRPQLGDMLPVF
ncbi:substrate-binding periplasmic protein [Pseudoalteromonas xiamenensis]